MSNRPAWFPMYPNDFASDSKVELMNTEEVGAYILLLCKAWREDPPGSIPNNDTVLARWARMDSTTWSRCRSNVLAPFVLGTDDRYHQKRMRAEFQKSAGLLSARSKAGKRGASSRWKRPDYGNAIGNVNGKANGKDVASSCDCDCLPSLTSSGREGGVGETVPTFAPEVPIQQPDEWRRPKIPPPLDVDVEFCSLWAEWNTHLIAKGKFPTEVSARRQLAELAIFGVARASAAIRHSLAAGWKTLHEPRKDAAESDGKSFAERVRDAASKRRGAGS